MTSPTRGSGSATSWIRMSPVSQYFPAIATSAGSPPSTRLAGAEAALATHLVRDREGAFHRLAVRVDLADLRADVRVEAVQLELWPREDRAHSRFGCAARDVEAELRVLGSGQQVRVRMSVDAGPDAQEDRRTRIAFRGDASEECDLVEVVDDDAAHAFRARDEQLVLALVVAVKEDPVAGKIGARRRVQLAA